MPTYPHHVTSEAAAVLIVVVTAAVVVVTAVVVATVVVGAAMSLAKARAPARINPKARRRDHPVKKKERTGEGTVQGT